MNGWRNIPRDHDFPIHGQRVLVWDSFNSSWSQARFHEESKRFRVGNMQTLQQFEWWHPGPEFGPDEQARSAG